MKDNRVVRKKVQRFIGILVLFIIPIVLVIVINIKPTFYYSKEEIQEIKDNMVDATLLYQNEEGLFIETSIDHNYRAVESLSFIPLVNAIPVIHDRQALIRYVWSKQTPFEGGYSDVALLGNMEDTYKVFKTIQTLNASFLNHSGYYRFVNQKLYISNENKTTFLLDFIYKAYQNDTGGFVAKPRANQPDLASTWHAMELLAFYNASCLPALNDSVAGYVESLREGNGTTGYSYRLSNVSYLPDPVATCYGLKIRALLGRAPDLAEAQLFKLYLDSMQNPLDRGYSDIPGTPSDIFTTYNALFALDLLGYTSNDVSGCQGFVLSCKQADGGFSESPVVWNSDFISGWAALASLNLTHYIFPTNETFLGYQGWLRRHEALNSLFGFPTLEAIYNAVTTVENAGYNLHQVQARVINLSAGPVEGFICIENITSFVYSCWNPDGGFSQVPGANSTIRGTHRASEIARILEIAVISKNTIRLNGTMHFLVAQQNEDGGFKLGDEAEAFLALVFGESFELYANILDDNLSAVHTSFWAYVSLQNIRKSDGSLNRSLDFERTTTFNRTGLVRWTKSLQNADGGYCSVTGFKSEVTGTFHALALLDALYQQPDSLLSAIEFIIGSQAGDGGFVLSPFFASYLGGGSTLTFSYYALATLYRNSFQPADWLRSVIYLGLCLDPLNYGFGDIPLFGSDLRNGAASVYLIDTATILQLVNPAPWTPLIIGILLIEMGIFLVYSIYKMFEKIGLLEVRRRRARMVQRVAGAIGEIPAIMTQNLTVFGGRKAIIKNVSIEVHHGEILGVLGESGAGKSTFVKALLGMRRFTGTNLMYGMNMKRSSRKLKPLYGYVPQDLSKIYGNFSVMENLLYFGRQYGLSEKEVLRRGERLLRNLGIGDKANDLVKNLSGGQKRRVSIAIALVHDPIFCILDEPTSGLDPVVRESLWLRLVELNEQFGTTFIVITHYPEESRFCDKVAIFGRKRGMIDFGNPRQLLCLLPGHGRAIDLLLNNKVATSMEILKKQPWISNVLEKKDGEYFTIFTDEGIVDVRRKIEKLFKTSDIKAITQEDVEMEDYFRYKALEVVIER